MNISFHPRGPLDYLIEGEALNEIEYGFELELESRKESGDAERAVGIVEIWLLHHSFTHVEGDTVTFVSGCEAAGLSKDTPYLEAQSWDEKLREEHYTAHFWDNLFENRNYLAADNGISGFIPDNEIERMVLYFLRKWKSRLYSYITDDDVPEKHRLAVLEKQVQNFTLIYRKKCFGSIWKMTSEPNELLLKALEAGGSVVLPTTDIMGNTITVTADISMPTNAGEGPTPDGTDRKIYHYIVRYAKSKLRHDEVHDSWSMVRASFRNMKGVDVRSYAFSGRKDSSKELHKMPQQWFQERSGPDEFGDEMEVDVSNVDCRQLGQNMVLAIFRAMKGDIKQDLTRLTTHIALDEKATPQSLILEARKDMTSMDYGVYYDWVIKEMNNYDGRLDRAIHSVVEDKMKDLRVDAETVKKDIRCFVSVGGKNKSFSPKENELKEYLLQQFNEKQEEAQKTLETLLSISEKQFDKLKGILNELPDKFLSVFEKSLKNSKCGEDNVIALVLQKVFSQYVSNLFLKADVKFVCLDSKHMEGKPFCSVCGSKVRFYSILPFLLRFIGQTDNNFHKITTLFSKLN